MFKQKDNSEDFVRVIDARIQWKHFVMYFSELRATKSSMTTGLRLHPTVLRLVEMLECSGFNHVFYNK